MCHKWDLSSGRAFGLPFILLRSGGKNLTMDDFLKGMDISIVNWCNILQDAAQAWMEVNPSAVPKYLGWNIDSGHLTFETCSKLFGSKIQKIKLNLIVL
jgi:hypothetical protein